MAPVIGLPPRYHWRDGLEPPLTGEAWKVTNVPEQTVPDGSAAMVRLTGSRGLTVTVITFWEPAQAVPCVDGVTMYCTVPACV